MRLIGAIIFVLLSPAVVEAPTCWSLSWPQEIMKANGVVYTMAAPGGDILKDDGTNMAELLALLD